MTKIFRLEVGNKDVVADVKNFRLELKQKRRIAKADNKVFKRGFNEFGVAIVDGELWLVGYKSDLTFHKNGLK